MGKNKSALVGGARLAAAIWLKLDSAVREAGGSEEDLHRLATDEGDETIKLVAALIVGKLFDGDPYPARFQAAIAACNFDWVHATPEKFPERVFGEVGEGHILAQPPATGKGYWTEQEINSWLEEKAKEGYEAATLADGLDFVAKNQRVHLDGPVLFWASVSSDGSVAYLYRNGFKRDLFARRRFDSWLGTFRFLLRKVPDVKSGQVAKP
jgi:hypothetical protein